MGENLAEVPSLALRQEDAAKALGMCSKTLRSITAPRGPIPAVKVGRLVLYPVAALEAFLARGSNADAESVVSAMMNRGEV